VQELYGQLAKKIVDRALPLVGAVHIEHEIPIADAQSGDVYFVPEPGKEAERAHIGYLDHLTREPCLLEMMHSTPGPVVVRDNVRKQLTLDHAIALDAAKQKRPRPALLRLWMLCAGRPREVLAGYGFTRAKGMPAGFWVRSRLDSVGIVVLSELPRRRDTLLLRLFGRGKVLEQAIADLKALPEDAKEREIAYAPLVALRFEVAQDPNPDQEARAFLMATQDLYEQWETRVKNDGRAEGRQEGLLVTLASIYEGRFGLMPDRLQKALAKKADLETIGKWVTLFTTASAKEIAAAVRKGQPTR
jgi:hypothetical protein